MTALVLRRWALAVALSAAGLASAADRTSVALYDDGTPAVRALARALEREGFSPRFFSAAETDRLCSGDARALAIADGRRAPLAVAARAVDWIRHGRPAAVLGAPLAPPARPPVPEPVEKIPVIRSWTFAHGERENVRGEWREEQGTLRFSFSKVADWCVFGSPRNLRLAAAGTDVLVFSARAEADGTDLQVEVNEKDGTRWFATVEVNREWKRHALYPEDFSGRAKRPISYPDLNFIGFSMCTETTPRMIGRGATFEIREIGSARDPDPSWRTALPFQDALEPHWKFGETADAFTPCPRHDGAGAFRNSPWRLQRLSAGEWIFLERRTNMPERAFFASGWKDERRLHAQESLDRAARALARLVREPVLFAAGTRHMSYDPGEAVLLGAEWRAGTAPARLELRVTDGSGRELWRGGTDVLPGGSPRWAAHWQAPSEPGAYRVETRMGADAIAHEFTVMKTEPDPPESFVRVRGDRFVLGEREWNPAGVNYVPLSCSGLNPEDYRDAWLDDEYYDPATVEEDLAQFAGLGGNMIAIQAPWRPYWRNLPDVLRIARKHGLRVCLFVRELSPLDFRREDWRRYAHDAHLANDSTIFAYDIAWEVGFKVFPPHERNKPRRRADWVRWIEEEYGSVAAAEQAWGCAALRDEAGAVQAPPDRQLREDGPWNRMTTDYRRFMDDWTSRRWNRARQFIRAEDPNHLITYRQGNTVPFDFTFTGPVRHLDFIAPEGYMVSDDAHGENVIAWVTQYAAAVSGKPVLWMEFSRNSWRKTRNRTDPEELKKSAAYCERYYRTGLEYGACGVTPWWWPGGFRYRECSDYGMIGPAREVRPLAEVFRKYADAYRAPRMRPKPGVFMDFDRDAHAGGYWRAALVEGAAKVAEAKRTGQTLGIRLAGADADSRTCEKRLLRGEFDLLEVKPVAGGIRLKAQLGNPGQVKWLPASAGKGGVSLALVGRDGKTFARVPVPCEVPRFGDTGVLTADVKVPTTAWAPIRFRLEAEGRGLFGETRYY